MIQRIQSVFLLLVALCMLTTLFFPVWSSGDMETSSFISLTPWDLRINGDVKNFPYAFIGILAVNSIIVAIIELFQYKKRLLQMKLGALNSLFMAGTMILSVVFYNQLTDEYSVEGDFGLALFLPAAAMIFNVLANRFIRKDEKLVRSADRIR